MAGLMGRVRSLERRAGVRGECAACGGRGTPTFEVWIDGDRTRPEAGGCGACGRRGVVTRLMIDGPDEVPARTIGRAAS